MIKSLSCTILVGVHDNFEKSVQYFYLDSSLLSWIQNIPQMHQKQLFSLQKDLIDLLGIFIKHLVEYFQKLKYLTYLFYI